MLIIRLVKIFVLENEESCRKVNISIFGLKFCDLKKHTLVHNGCFTTPYMSRFTCKRSI